MGTDSDLKTSFIIQTRQKDDLLFSRAEDEGDIAPAGSVSFPVRRVSGYGSVRFLAVSTESMLLRIEQAPTVDGPWVETDRVASVASTSGSGQQLICAGVGPCSVFMRVFIDNVGGSPAPAAFSGFGHPISGGSVGGGGGGGIAAVVELEDGGGGLTRASVKTDGTLVGGQGSVLAGGRDPSGKQRAVAVTESGQIIFNNADAPFTPTGPTALISVTDAAQDGVQVLGTDVLQYRILNNGLVVVYVAFGTSAADAKAKAVIPTGSGANAEESTPIPPGMVDIISAPADAYWAAIVPANDSADLYITPGKGW